MNKLPDFDRAILGLNYSGFHDTAIALVSPEGKILYPCALERISHAASDFYLSGLDEALCLVYDGGMSNCPWFGGLYRASRQKGIEPLDRFSTAHYAKITSLYSVVTGLLGFSPNKHEGKITGLA